jgi:uncharacterized protein involved in outer membrane biogenesis
MQVKKGFKIVLVVAAAFIVLIGATVATLFALYPPEKIKALVLPQVEKSLGRSIQVQKVGISFFPFLGMRFTGLEISNTTREGFSTKPFVSLDEFLLKVNLLSLLEKRLDINRIVLRGPRILVEVDKNGKYNFDDLAVVAKDTTKKAPQAAPQAAALPIPLTLRHFIIENGAVMYDDRKSGMRVAAGAINQRVDVSMDRDLKNIRTTGELKVADISFMSKEVKKPLSGLTVTFSHDLRVDLPAGVLTINQVRASFQKVFVSLNGKVSDFNTAPVLDLAVRTDSLSIADIVAEVPASLAPEIAKIKASGMVQALINIQGQVKPAVMPAVRGHIIVRNGLIQYADLPQSINGMNADIAFTENSVDITDFAMNLGKNPVRIKALVQDFKAPQVDAQVDASVNLGELKDVIKMPQGNGMSGSIEAHVTAKGRINPAAPASMDVKGGIRCAGITLHTPALIKPLVLNGNIGFTPKSIDPDLTATIGASIVKLKASVTDFLTLALPAAQQKTAPRPKVNFSVASSLLDANEMLPKPAAQTAAAQKPAPAASGREGPIMVAPLPGVDMNGTIAIDRMRYTDMELTNVTGKISSVNDVMTVTLKARLLGGGFSHDLVVDAKNIADLKVKSGLNVDNVEISQFLAAVKGMVPPSAPLSSELKKLDKSIFGKAVVKSDLTTSGATMTNLMDRLNGAVVMKVADGRIANGELISSISSVVSKFMTLGDIPFKDLTMKASIRDKKITIEDLSVNSASMGDWKAAGQVGFEGGLGINLSDKLTKELSRPLLALQSKGKDALKGILGSTPLGQAGAGFLDKAGIPADKDGRVTLLIGLGGLISKPQPGFKGFGTADASKGQSAAPAASPQMQLKESLAKKQQEVQGQIKQEAMKKAAELEEKAKQIPAVKEAEKSKEVQDLKKKAAEKLGKMF